MAARAEGYVLGGVFFFWLSQRVHSITDIDIDDQGSNNIGRLC